VTSRTEIDPAAAREGPSGPPVRDVIARALAEDLGAGDLTSRLVVPEDATARGLIGQKAPGVVAGLDVAGTVFRQVDPSLRWHPHAEEGRRGDGGPLAEVAGSARSILAGERVALNFLGRLSGVATLTRLYVDAVEGTGARILDTRKTTPGLRALERRAVAAGGGVNHRDGLYDAVLVKENHAAVAGGVGEAARRVVAGAPPGVGVIVECASLEELDEALTAGVPRVLLDNMSVEETRAAVERVGGRAVVEASGGVSVDAVRTIAEAGVDLISVGALTHSAPALDVSLSLHPL
jgi:nicotinate-nucleotide pyrophosphorylase (carboxylating)